jgi:hypothetical protein
VGASQRTEDRGRRAAGSCELRATRGGPGDWELQIGDCKMQIENWGGSQRGEEARREGCAPGLTLSCGTI